MTAALHIRPYQRDDLDAVARITRRAWGGVTLGEARERHLGGIIGEQDWRDRKEAEIRQLCARHPEHFVVGVLGGASAENSTTAEAAAGESVVVGYASWSVDADGVIGTVGNNAVDPTWQGRGYGHQLIAAVIDELVAARVQVLQVQTMEQDEPARRLYHRHGFDEIARTVHYVRRAS